MVFLRGSLGEKEASSKWNEPSEHHVTPSNDRKSSGGRKARELAHHYIMTPIGKPQNTTEGTSEEVQPTSDGAPLIVMPPGPVIIEKHDPEDDKDDNANGEGSDEDGNEVDTEGENPDADKGHIYDDNDSGEDKVAAMIEAMQNKARDGGDPLDEENGENEDLGDEGEDAITKNTEDDGGAEEATATSEPRDEENGDLSGDVNEDITESENESTGDQEPEESTNEDVDGEIDQQDSDSLPSPEPDDEDNIDLPTETPDDTTNEEFQGDEAKNDEDSAGNEGDAEGDEAGGDTEEESEPGDEENSDVPTETPGETNDELPGNDEDSAGIEGDAVDDEADQGDTEEKPSGEDAGESENGENSGGNEGEPNEDAPDENEPGNGEIDEPIDTLAPADDETTEPPTPAPTVITSDQKVVVTASPTLAPVDETPADPTDAPSPAPSNTPLDINKVDHDDSAEAKSREKQPHTATPSGTTDSSSPAAFGALCRHPSGLVQGANCKIIRGIQSHPLAFTGAFFICFIWACCLCKRVCKGRRRREDNHGEYRAVAAQYDDVLFSDTFDDNYSASFADDRSADGSIESDEEDDWTKGPNIEMSGVTNKKDDLTLEEMNG